MNRESLPTRPAAPRGGFSAASPARALPTEAAPPRAWCCDRSSLDGRSAALASAIARLAVVADGVGRRGVARPGGVRSCFAGFFSPLSLVAMLASVAGWLSWVAPAAAQVNVETLRSSLAEEGFGGSADGSLTSYRGNTEGLALGGQTLIGVSSGAHLAYFNAVGSYSQIGGSVQVAKSFVHARYNYEIAKWFWGEAFVQAESDRQRRVAVRQLAGFGPRAALAQEPQFALYVGILHLIEYNRMRGDWVPVRPDWVQRLGTYAALVYEADVGADDQATFTSTAYYQPRYDELADYRVLWVSSIDFTIGARLRAGINATVRHESPVAETLKKGDLTVVNTLGVKF